MKSDFIDDLLAFGSLFDWITPAFSLLQDLSYQSISDFGIQAGAGWYKSDIRRLLHSYDIKVWGLAYDRAGSLLMFTVRGRDADYVFDILMHEGVPIIFAPTELIEQGYQSSY